MGAEQEADADGVDELSEVDEESRPMEGKGSKSKNVSKKKLPNAVKRRMSTKKSLRLMKNNKSNNSRSPSGSILSKSLH